MIKRLHESNSILATVLAIGFCIPVLVQAESSVSGCSDAGTATASEDSVCYSTPVDLVLSGYVGTIFQWQSYDGTNWVDETGPGSNTDSYSVSLLSTTMFRAIVTEISCPPDTSNEITVEVGTIAAPSGTPATRCGPGIVNLQGTGSGTLKWYTVPTGGSAIASGANTTAFIPSSTTLWLEDNALGGASLASGLQITEINIGNNDDLEVQNVSPLPIDVTGWKVLISNSYPDINISNPNVQVLNGIMQPGDIMTWTDLATAPNYWGSNMLWNPGAFPTFTGWALILDSTNAPMDFVIWGWPSANITAMSLLVDGTTVIPSTIWTGDGIDATTVAATDGLSRTGTSDNNNLSDFTIAALTIAVTNPQMTLPFTGFGCTSPRVPVAVTISPSDSISINASSTALCLSGSATFTATSANPNYVYTWSPPDGLNTTSGSTVISTPLVTTTYVVIGDDGVCSNVDTVSISVGAPTVAGTASTLQDTICLSNDTDLMLTGSTGLIQWQSFSGGTWINETGPGSDSPVYNVAPTINTTYRAYVYSGSCPPDSSNLIDVVVLSITDPVTTNDTVCGTGAVSLSATGVGTLTWYTEPTGGTIVNSGAAFNFTATQTDTFYVEAFAGTQYHIGPADPSIGNQASSTSNNWAMAFDVIRPVTIDVVYVYPNTNGALTINLRQTAGGPVLATYTQSMVAFSGKTAVPVGFSVPVGTGYRLEVASGGPVLSQNSTGAAYPYTIANGPLSITGYYNPNFNSGALYLWMYDWEVSEGCHSTRIPAIAVVNPLPPIPVISQNWNTLNSTSPVGNQWLFNGSIIPGATDQFLVITQTGNYTVAVTINGCTSISAIFQVTFIGINELPDEVISIYPNPVSHELQVSLQQVMKDISMVCVFDVTGRQVLRPDLSEFSNIKSISIPVTALPQGIYIIEVTSKSGVARKQFLVQR